MPKNYTPHKMMPRKDIEYQLKRCLEILEKKRAEPFSITRDLGIQYYSGMVEAYRNVLG